MRILRSTGTVGRRLPPSRLGANWDSERAALATPERAGVASVAVPSEADPTAARREPSPYPMSLSVAGGHRDQP
jgi:hypothetical protein